VISGRPGRNRIDPLHRTARLIFTRGRAAQHGGLAEGRARDLGPMGNPPRSRPQGRVMDNVISILLSEATASPFAMVAPGEASGRTSTGKNDGRSSADGMNRGSRSHLKTMLAFTS